MYYKRCSGTILLRKSADDPEWVQWVHHNDGVSHCQECLKLDGCWFQKDNVPFCQRHFFCHCTLEPLDYATVVTRSIAVSDYSKYVPYLFNTNGGYTHNKEKLFKEWGYTAEDADWLKAEIERQGREKYISGDYQLGKLNDKGQRISIRITITRRDTGTEVSFITGWMVYPDGRIQLTTPYGGK